jgi:hypothetical protein
MAKPASILPLPNVTDCEKVFSEVAKNTQMSTNVRTLGTIILIVDRIFGF